MSDPPLQYTTSNIFPRKILMIRSELYIIISSGVLAHQTKRETSTTSPMFELTYTRRGRIYGTVENTLVEVRPGYALAGFMGSVCGHAEYEKGEDIQLYSIWMSPRVFDGFCEAISEKTGVNFFHLFQNKMYSYYSSKTDIQEEMVLRKLDTFLFNQSDKLNRLLVESCILELLSINLERLLCENNAKERSRGLSRSEIDSLKYAREILLTRLESPPTLLELSQLIHLNDCKLKKTFKHFFGKTVYEFVREQRLEKAFYLLESGICNVSESAFAVGYTNVSHFSETFKKKYGMLPHVVKKERHPSN